MAKKKGPPNQGNKPVNQGSAESDIFQQVYSSSDSVTTYESPVERLFNPSDRIAQRLQARIGPTQGLAELIRNIEQGVGRAASDQVYATNRFVQEAGRSIDKDYRAAEFEISNAYSDRALASYVTKRKEEMGASEKEYVQSRHFDWQRTKDARDRAKDEIESNRLKLQKLTMQHKSVVESIDYATTGIENLKNKFPGETDAEYQGRMSKISQLEGIEAQIRGTKTTIERDRETLALNERRLEDARHHHMNPRGQFERAEKLFSGAQQDYGRLGGGSGGSVGLSDIREANKKFKESMDNATEALNAFKKATAEGASEEEKKTLREKFTSAALKAGDDQATQKLTTQQFLNRMSNYASYLKIGEDVAHAVAGGAGQIAAWQENTVDMQTTKLQARTANLARNNQSFFDTMAGIQNLDVAAYRRGTAYAPIANRAAQTMHGISQSAANTRTFQAGFELGETILAETGKAIVVGGAALATGGVAGVGIATAGLKDTPENLGRSVNNFRTTMSMADTNAYMRTGRYRDAVLALQEERDRMPNWAAQQAMNVWSNVGQASMGLGGARGYMMDQALDKDFRSQLVQFGVSDPSALLGQFGQSAGRSFNMRDLANAAKSEFAGYTTRGQFAAGVGAFTEVGGQGRDFQSMITEGVRIGMDTSKSIHQMTQATVQLAQRDAGAGFFGTGVGRSEQLMQLLGSTSIADIDPNMKVSMAARQMALQSDITTNASNTGFKDVVEYMRIKNQFPNMDVANIDRLKKIGQGELQGVRGTIASLLKGGTPEELRRAAQQYNALGLTNSFTDTTNVSAADVQSRLSSLDEMIKLKAYNFGSYAVQKYGSDRYSFVADMSRVEGKDRESVVQKYMEKFGGTKQQASDVVGAILSEIGPIDPNAPGATYKGVGRGTNLDRFQATQVKQAGWQNLAQRYGSNTADQMINDIIKDNPSFDRLQRFQESQGSVAEGGYNFQGFNDSVVKFDDAVEKFLDGVTRTTQKEREEKVAKEFQDTVQRKIKERESAAETDKINKGDTSYGIFGMGSKRTADNLI